MRPSHATLSCPDCPPKSSRRKCTTCGGTGKITRRAPAVEQPKTKTKGKTTAVRESAPARKTTAQQVTQAMKAAKLVADALKAGVVLHYEMFRGNGTIGPHRTAVPTSRKFAIHRYGVDTRTSLPTEEYTDAQTAAHAMIEDTGTGRVIDALKLAAKKAGVEYKNLDTPIAWPKTVRESIPARQATGTSVQYVVVEYPTTRHRVGGVVRSKSLAMAAAKAKCTNLRKSSAADFRIERASTRESAPARGGGYMWNYNDGGRGGEEPHNNVMTWAQLNAEWKRINKGAPPPRGPGTPLLVRYPDGSVSNGRHIVAVTVSQRESAPANSPAELPRGMGVVKRGKGWVWTLDGGFSKTYDSQQEAHDAGLAWVHSTAAASWTEKQAEKLAPRRESANTSDFAVGDSVRLSAAGKKEAAHEMPRIPMLSGRAAKIVEVGWESGRAVIVEIDGERQILPVRWLAKTTQTTNRESTPTRGVDSGIRSPSLINYNSTPEQYNQWRPFVLAIGEKLDVMGVAADRGDDAGVYRAWREAERAHADVPPGGHGAREYPAIMLRMDALYERLKPAIDRGRRLVRDTRESASTFIVGSGLQWKGNEGTAGHGAYAYLPTPTHLVRGRRCGSLHYFARRADGSLDRPVSIGQPANLTEAKKLAGAHNLDQVLPPTRESADAPARIRWNVVNPNDAGPDVRLSLVRLDDRGDLCVYVWRGGALRNTNDAMEEAEEYAPKVFGRDVLVTDDDGGHPDTQIYTVTDADEIAAVLRASQNAPAGTGRRWKTTRESAGTRTWGSTSALLTRTAAAEVDAGHRKGHLKVNLPALQRAIGIDPGEVRRLADARVAHAGHFTVEIGNTSQAPRLVPVRTFSEASEVVNAFVTKTGMGASGMIPHFGEIRDTNSKLVGRISYNGRIWGPDGQEIGSGDRIPALAGPVARESAPARVPRLTASDIAHLQTEWERRVRDNERDPSDPDYDEGGPEPVMTSLGYVDLWIDGEVVVSGAGVIYRMERGARESCGVRESTPSRALTAPIRWDEVRTAVHKRYPAFDYVSAEDVRHVAEYGDWTTGATDYIFRFGSKPAEFGNPRFDDSTNALVHYIKNGPSVRSNLVAYFGDPNRT